MISVPSRLSLSSHTHTVSFNHQCTDTTAEDTDYGSQCFTETETASFKTTHIHTVSFNHPCTDSTPEETDYGSQCFTETETVVIAHHSKPHTYTQSASEPVWPSGKALGW